MRVSTSFFLLLIAVIFSSAVSGQGTVHPGIQAFRAGKVDEAIKLLEKAKGEDAYKEDADIWNTLGLAYIEKKDLKKAEKSFDKAVDLQPTSTANRINLAYVLLINGKPGKTLDHTAKVLKTEPDNYTALYLNGKAALWTAKLDLSQKSAERMIAVQGSDARGYLLRSEVLLNRIGTTNDREMQIEILQKAVATLKDGLANSKTSRFTTELTEELENTAAIERYFSRSKGGFTPIGPVAPEPGVTPLKIISKPRPEYTNEARNSLVSGVIVAAVLFGASGKVENVLIIKRLGAGLDQQAVRAARGIKFEPVKENGKPVSVVKLVEYSFEIR
jgi:TonB family protein